MALRSLSLHASLARQLTPRRPPPACTPSPLSLSLYHPSTRLRVPQPLACRFHTSPLRSAVLSPPSASQSDPDPTLHTPLSHEDAPTLKEALDPALWFPDAEPAPAPPTAHETATAAAATATNPNTPSPTPTPAPSSTSGSAETGGLYYTAIHPHLHAVAPIAQAIAPLPCAYTPPDIAPLMDVDDIKRAMECVIVGDDDDEVDDVAGEGQEGVKVVEVKGLEELLEDVKADEAEAKSEKALVVGTT